MLMIAQTDSVSCICLLCPLGAVSRVHCHVCLLYHQPWCTQFDMFMLCGCITFAVCEKQSFLLSLGLFCSCICSGACGDLPGVLTYWCWFCSLHFKPTLLTPNLHIPFPRIIKCALHSFEVNYRRG